MKMRRFEVIVIRKGHRVSFERFFSHVHTDYVETDFMSRARKLIERPSEVRKFTEGSE